MASVKTNFAVGVFMIIGIVIATAVFIYVGASTILRPGQLYSTFYDESIQGLSKDSPVKYRGVGIGQVHNIRIAEGTRLVEVLLRIESEWEPDEATVAQLKAIGITGIMYVELDIKQPEEKVLYPDPNYETEYPVIPTRSSDISQLLSGIEEVVKQVRGTDFQGISLKMQDTINTIDQAIKDARVARISSGLENAIEKASVLFTNPQLQNILASAESTGNYLNEFAQKADAVTTRLEKMVTDNEADFNQAILELRKTMKQARLLINDSAGTINKTEESISSIQDSLIRTINHLESVSRNLDTLTDRTASQPSLLFFGEPPPDKTIESYD